MIISVLNFKCVNSPHDIIFDNIFVVIFIWSVFKITLEKCSSESLLCTWDLVRLCVFYCLVTYFVIQPSKVRSISMSVDEMKYREITRSIYHNHWQWEQRQILVEKCLCYSISLPLNSPHQAEKNILHYFKITTKTLFTVILTTINLQVICNSMTSALAIFNLNFRN